MTNGVLVNICVVSSDTLSPAEAPTISKSWNHVSVKDAEWDIASDNQIKIVN